MLDNILKSKHVHLAGTTTIDVVVDLLKNTNYTVYTNAESILELRAKLPKVNVLEYTLPFKEDSKEPKLVCLPVSDKDTAVLTHSLFGGSTKCWTFQKDWERGAGVLGKKLTDKSHVIVHCFDSKVIGVSNVY